MSNLKHTPRPWVVKETSQEGCYDIIVDDKNWTDYGKIWVASTISVNKLQEECKANAKLIAAAPEMFEAMKIFVERCEKGEVRSTKTYNSFKEIIKKATE